MRSLFSCGSLALSLVVSAVAQAAPAEVPVCVTVLVERASSKRSASTEHSAAPRTEVAVSSSAPAAPGEPEASSDAPGETPKKRVTRRTSEDSATSLDALTDLDPDGTQDPRVKSGAYLPLGQTPELYLKRLLEHFVTHEKGFVAVKEGCQQQIVVELYPLRLGWTAFSRYSGSGREERIDQLLPTELSQFAERSVLALLRDVAISETVDRSNVLWADSLKATQRIRGRGHVALGLGTRARVGRFDTAVRDVDSPNYGGTEQSLRVFTPMLMMAAYRGQFEEFGVEAGGEFDLGTSQVGARHNPLGGHIDYGGSMALILHAMRYTNTRGLSSLYYGGGATFSLHWFNAISPEADRLSDPRSTLFTGGLDIDAILGYEFMRASAVSFFLQGELNLPSYAVRSEDASGSISSWFPGAALKLGSAF